MTLLAALDYLSVWVFALTGALVASRKQLDIVGFVFLAFLTAVGGGTVRDVVLDRNPVFWIGDPNYLVIATFAAVLVYFTAHLMESRYNWLIWLDSFALAVAVPAGVTLALQMLQPPIIVILMGVTTGCVGGLMRDVVCNEMPLVLKHGELYASAALVGSLVAINVMDLTGSAGWMLVSCMGTTWILRAGSLYFGWRLPTYKARPPKA